MAEPNQRWEEKSFEAPEKVVAALSDLQKERIFVPPTVDEAVLEGARQHLRRLERPQSWWKPWLSWATMAACLATALWLGERFSNRTRAHLFAREDINRDGRVDVLDAFALARQIETGAILGLRWDINGDGRVDRADVNAIAARAVSLAQAGPEQKRRADVRPHRTTTIRILQTDVRAPFFAVTGLRLNALTESQDQGRSCQHWFGAQCSAELCSAVLSPKIIASCEDFFNAEAAKDRAEERGGDFFCGLCESLCGLCVEGALLVCLVAASPRCAVSQSCTLSVSVEIVAGCANFSSSSSSSSSEMGSRTRTIWLRLCRAAPYRRFVICVASQWVNAWDRSDALPNKIQQIRIDCNREDHS